MNITSKKEEAIKLRKLGYSYNLICEKIKVSKSTLHYWLAGMTYTPNEEVLSRIGKARAASGAAKSKLKLASISEATIHAEADIGQLTQRDIFMLGIGIYIGEGSKTDQIRIVNSNPEIIKFAIKWLKQMSGIQNENFRIRIHLYPDTDIEQTKKFWLSITNLPELCFQKPQIDMRLNKKKSNMHKLPYGTAHLSVVSNGKKEYGSYLARRINGWMQHVLR